MPTWLLSTASLYFDRLEGIFGLARQTGFEGLELSVTPASAWAGAARLRELARACGLVLPSVHPATVPLPGWGSSPTALRRLVGLARALPGCRAVVLHLPSAHGGADPRLQRFYRRLEALQEALAGTAITVALENRNCRPGEAPGLFDRPEAWLELAEASGCGLVLDTAHASTMPMPLLEVYQAVCTRLVNIHLSDVVPLGWWERFSYPRSTLSHHRLPGTGTLPLGELLGRLGDAGYAGLITLELSPLALRFWNRAATRRLLVETLRNCRRWFEARSSRESPHSCPANARPGMSGGS